jgi:hypothetical protein
VVVMVGAGGGEGGSASSACYACLTSGRFPASFARTTKKVKDWQVLGRNGGYARAAQCML